MDINRVELKGRIASDVMQRHKENGDVWLTFTVATNEYNKQADIKFGKSIPTWTQVAVFNPVLVRKLITYDARQGSHIWLVGKLFAKNAKKGDITVTHTTVVANELELIKRTSNKNETFTAPDVDIDNEPF